MSDILPFPGDDPPEDLTTEELNDLALSIFSEVSPLVSDRCHGLPPKQRDRIRRIVGNGLQVTTEGGEE